MTRTLKLLLAVALSAAFVAATPMRALAQDPAQQKITLDLDSVDVREALRALFKSVGVSYTIDPTVQGTVTVNMKQQPFETVLLNVLRQVEATYRIDGGIYMIVKREAPLPDVPAELNPVKSETKIHRKVYVNRADPMLIAALIGKDGGQTNFNMAPEMSTVLNTPHGGSGNGGFGNGGLGGGNSFGNGMNGNRNGGGSGNGRNGNGIGR